MRNKKEKYYTFHKRSTNVITLKRYFIYILSTMLFGFLFKMAYEFDSINSINSLKEIQLLSLSFAIKFMVTVFTVAILYKLLTKPLWYWKYSYRLNTLFEQLAKNETISEKIIFPKIKLSYNNVENSFKFKFLWQGKLSETMQNEVSFRLPEILFPNNEYMLEGPIEDQAFTTYKYVKYADRLEVNYDNLEPVNANSRSILLNESLKWDLYKQAHASVTGMTGSGKTMFLYYLIIEAANLTNDIYIVDGKSGDLSTLSNVKQIATTAEDTVDLFHSLINEMDERFETIKKSEYPTQSAYTLGYKDVFVFIDELAVIVELAKTLDQTNEQKNKENSRNQDWEKLKENNYDLIISSIRMLIFKARQANIHLVLATQNFETSLLGSSAVRDNLGLKILFGNPSTVQVNQMGLTQEQLPYVDYSVKGAGIIWLDGQGWVNARPFESPYLNFKNKNPNQLLKKIKNF